MTFSALFCLALIPGRFLDVWGDTEQAPEPARLVLFSASWCGPCQALKAQLSGLDSKGWTYGAAKTNHFQIVDVDEEPELWARLRKPGSSSIPQAVFLVGGKPVRWLVAPESAAALTWFYVGRKTAPASASSGRGVEVRPRVPDFGRIFR